MKKIAPIVAIAALVAFSSCKKDYTCTCTASLNGQSYGSTSTTIKNTKSKAKTACTALQSTANYGGVSVTSTCELK